MTPHFDRRAGIGLILLSSIVMAAPALAQSANGKGKKRGLLGQVFGGGAGAAAGTGLTAELAEKGMREALTLGAGKVVAQVSKVGGYFLDPAIQIPLPGALAGAQKRLKPLGLSKPLDDVQERVNAAAEQAAPVAKDLFVNAISTMSVEDAIGIVKGPNDSATQYLKSRTSEPLTAAFRPAISGALDNTGAIAALQDTAGRYGAGALATNASANLSDFAVGKALDGMFFYIGKEEAAIRTNPAARTTDLLKQVFGGV